MAAMSTDAPAPAPSPRWMKLLLVLSLTANLLVIGVIAGHELRRDDRRGASRTVGWILELVPEERRAMSEAHFAAALADLETAERDRSTEAAAVIAAIRAEPYDAAAVQSAMADYGASRAEDRAKRWTLLRERLSTLLAEFTPAERAAFADGLDERMDRWRKRRGN
jgi:uncharacterized membrane protein